MACTAEPFGGASRASSLRNEAISCMIAVIQVYSSGIHRRRKYMGGVDEGPDAIGQQFPLEVGAQIAHVPELPQQYFVKQFL